MNMKGKFPVCMNRTSGQSFQIDENPTCHNKGDNGNSYRDFFLVVTMISGNVGVE